MVNRLVQYIFCDPLTITLDINVIYFKYLLDENFKYNFNNRDLKC